MQRYALLNFTAYYYSTWEMVINRERERVYQIARLEISHGNGYSKSISWVYFALDVTCVHSCIFYICVTARLITIYNICIYMLKYRAAGIKLNCTPRPMWDMKLVQTNKHWCLDIALMSRPLPCHFSCLKMLSLTSITLKHADCVLRSPNIICLMLK